MDSIEERIMTIRAQMDMVNAVGYRYLLDLVDMGLVNSGFKIFKSFGVLVIQVH